MLCKVNIIMSETFVVMNGGKPTTLIKSKENLSKDISSSSDRKLPFKFSGKDNTDQIEAKRLKTENALLLQKIKFLEDEISKLTKFSASYIEESDKTNIISKSKQHSMEISNVFKSFSNADTQTFFLNLDRTDINCNNNMTCLQCGSSVSSNIDLIRLVDQANRNSASNQIMLRIESPKTFSPLTPPQATPIEPISPCIPAQQQVDETFRKLQEELVACKLREAESSLGFKELQQKVNQLGKQWQQFMKDSEVAKHSADVKTRTLLDLRETIMALKIRETCMISDFNELKQKLIELETEINVSRRQSKRLEEESNKLEDKLSKASMREDELVNVTKDMERRISDLDAKYQEDLIMFKIRDAEWCQAMVALRNKVAELEIENQELLTALKLSNPKHSQMFEKIGSQQQTVKVKSSEICTDLIQQQNDKCEMDDLQQQSVIELLSRCDMSDIMTESFIADTMFLQPSSLLVGDVSLKERRPHDREFECFGDNLQSVDCDSLERLNV